MIIDIYRSTTNSEKFIAIQNGDELTTYLSKVTQIDSDYLSLNAHDINHDTLDEKLLRTFHPEEIVQSIQEKGYAVYGIRSKVLTNRVS